MKKLILSACALIMLLLVVHNSTYAQKTAKKKQTIESKASSDPSDEASKLVRPENDKDHPKAKSRGDVYGDNYSDIVVDNYTGYSIDIYVDGDYRGTLPAWDKKVTWAVPGNTRLFAKATFNDGTYLTWGPTIVRTGYQYTWKLTR